MLSSTRMKIGVPLALLAAALMATLALWAWNGATGGLTDSARIKGIISYEVRDAAGNLKESKVIYNTTTSYLLEAAEARLGTTASVADVPGDELVDNIELCQAPATPIGGVCTTLSDGLVLNPKDGTAATITVGSDGNADATGWDTSITFNADGASVIEGLQLTKGAVTDTTAATLANLMAYQNVSINLISGDTLTVTWKVDVD